MEKKMCNNFDKKLFPIKEGDLLKEGLFPAWGNRSIDPKSGEEDPIVVYGERFYALEDRTRQVAINALNELQGKWFLWKEKNFDETTGKGPEWQALGMAEEVGEVCRIILKAQQKIRQYTNGFDEKARKDLAKEIADVIIFSMQLCSIMGIDFGKTLFERSEEVMKRDWTKDKTNGANNG
jgi:NTP pyrophosphatase (non-canonical NTP hydrolase)